MCHSREDFGLDGRLEDEDDDQERKKQEDAQRKQRDPEDLPAVGAESRNRDVTPLFLRDPPRSLTHLTPTINRVSHTSFINAGRRPRKHTCTITFTGEHHEITRRALKESTCVSEKTPNTKANRNTQRVPVGCSTPPR